MMIGSVDALKSQLNRLAGFARRFPIDRVVVHPADAIHPDSQRDEGDAEGDDSHRPNRHVASYLRQQEVGTQCGPPDPEPGIEPGTEREPEQQFDSYA